VIECGCRGRSRDARGTLAALWRRSGGTLAAFRRRSGDGPEMLRGRGERNRLLTPLHSPNRVRARCQQSGDCLGPCQGHRNHNSQPEQRNPQNPQSRNGPLHRHIPNSQLSKVPKRPPKCQLCDPLGCQLCRPLGCQLCRPLRRQLCRPLCCQLCNPPNSFQSSQPH